MGKIYEIFGAGAHEMTKALLERARIADAVPPGADIALKPNLVVAASPESGATTHPGILSGCIEYFFEHGLRDVSIIEGSWVGDDTGRAMRRAGYDQVCRKYGVEFFDLKRDKTEEVDTPFGPIAVCRRALHAGYLVNLPVLKGHCQTVMTCCLKNCKGCLPDREKRRFHAAGLMKPIAALGCALKVDLHIVDSICGDLNFEEGGNPIHTNRMFMGMDPVQLDAYGARLMGLDLDDVPYIGFAGAWGGGSTAVGEEDIVRLNDPAQAGGYPKPSGTVARLTRDVHADSACSACYASLVRALYTTGNHTGRSIAIGQGWKGRPFDGIGIGRCCDCAAVKVAGCPPTAQAVAKALQST